jgi:putative FmdB family regulatory protein
MPTYEYQCGTCGNRFEKYQSFSDAPIKVCPECGNEVRKVYSAAGVIFKGSGWYINDSRKSGGSKSEAKADTASESKSSDSKTEAA